MTVYFIQSKTDDSCVKIGFTQDLAARVKNLSVSHANGVAVLATMPGGKETESYLHDLLAEHRIGGEWFRCSDQVRDLIRDVQNGTLPRMPFQDGGATMRRATSEYSKDAVEMARQMALALTNGEFRGIGDTADAARHRVEQKTGFPAAWLHRLQYRQVNDVPAGVYLHLVEITDAKAARGSKILWLADFVAGAKDGKGEVG